MRLALRNRTAVAFKALVVHALVACACLAAAAGAGAQSASEAEAKGSGAPAQREATPGATPSGSRVRGRVVYADSRRPLRRAEVTLFEASTGQAADSAVTDRRGEFVFEGVKAGRYFVVAEAPDVVSHAHRRGTLVTMLALGEIEGGYAEVSVGDKGTVEAEVRARRGGAITGRVTYGDDEPVTDARIVLYRRRGATVAPIFTDSFKTDDRGTYRVEGLPAGEYIVGVVERHAGGPNLLPRDGASLAAGYHPAAKSVREATAVRVEAGGEAASVNLTLAEERLPRIRGVVKWRQSDRPAEDATVMLRRRDDPAVEVSFTDLLKSVTPADADNTSAMMRDMAIIGMAASTTPYTETDAEGRWSFDDVTPGAYVLTVSARLPPSEEEAAKEKGLSDLDRRIAAGERRHVSQQRELNVGAEDAGAVTFELTEGGRVSGTVSTDDESAPPPVTIILDYRGASSLFNLPYRSNPDGTFLLEGVPAGEVRLDVRVNSATGYHLKSVTAGGSDLLREPLRVAEGTEAGGVRVELGRGRTNVSGRVLRSEGGAPFGGAGVLLFPADERLWHLRGARLFARADAEGAFSAGGAPGVYLVFVWAPGQEPSQPLEEYVRARAASARRVRLRADKDEKLDLHVPAAPAAPER